MAGEPIGAYTPETARRILERLDRLERQQNALLNGGYNQANVRPPVETRWAKVDSATASGTPTVGGAIEVALGDRVPDADPMTEGATFTWQPYDPKVELVAGVDDCMIPPDETLVRLEWRNGRWWVQPGPPLWKGVLVSDMCPNEDGQCNTLRALAWCGGEYDISAATQATAENLLGLAGEAGDKVLLVRQYSTDKPFVVVNVTHKTQDVVYDGYYENCALHFPTKSIVVMRCSSAATPNAITMYEHTYLYEASLVSEYVESMDPANSTCYVKLKGKTATFCAFEPASPSALQTLSTLTLVHLEVGGPVTDDGTCLQQYTQHLWAICATDPSVVSDVLCLSSCEGSSV